MLRIFGDEVPLEAQVEVLNGYSAHADRTELHAWLRAVRHTGTRDGRSDPMVHLVHGEHEAQKAFAEQLREDGFRVDIPAAGTRIAL